MSAGIVKQAPLSEVQNVPVPKKRAKLSVEEAEFQPILKFAKQSENATTPSRGSKLSAGFDLYRWVFKDF